MKIPRSFSDCMTQKNQIQDLVLNLIILHNSDDSDRYIDRKRDFQVYFESWALLGLVVGPKGSFSICSTTHIMILYFYFYFSETS